MKKAPFAGQPHRPHHVEFAKLLREIAYGHEPWRVFSDFCEMAATSLHNGVMPHAEREARYLDTVRRYTPEQAAIFPKLLGQTVLGLEEMECDFLGEVFGALDLANHWHGQFFTPWEVCRVIAGMTAPAADDPNFTGRGFIRVLEPACGAGAMVLAFARELRERGVDFQRRMHVVAIDIDRTAAMMAYTQFALWHIPALVCVGDALQPAGPYDVWPTPAHYLGMWDLRLRVRDATEAVEQAVDAAAQEPEQQPPPVDDVPGGAPSGQIKLF